MDELYKMMKGKLNEMYSQNQGKVVFSTDEFFKVYKLVCDMKQIQNIVNNQVAVK